MVTRRGLLVAGGSGTRWFPVTRALNKHLLPVYDKPLVYYPLSLLMSAGVQEILVVSTPRDLAAYRRLLGDGSHLGVRLDYAAQPQPGGIAQAFLIAEEFLRGHAVVAALGDNLFCGEGLRGQLRAASDRAAGATIFACPVPDPERFGVVQLAADGTPVALAEKPCRPLSNLAVTGLYFYDAQVVSIARAIHPSPRGELEITAVNQAYLEQGRLHVERLGRDDRWLDAGTPEGLLEASLVVRAWEGRTGRKLACPEEIALQQGWLQPALLLARARQLGDSAYAQYLRAIAQRAAAKDASEVR